MDFLKSVQTKPQQYLQLNSSKIIVPEKYNGHEDSGFDIAFIGFEESRMEIFDNYFESFENTDRILFFDDKKVTSLQDAECTTELWVLGYPGDEKMKNIGYP